MVSGKCRKEGGKMVTRKEVAEKAGVSVSVVSGP